MLPGCHGRVSFASLLRLFSCISLHLWSQPLLQIHPEEHLTNGLRQGSHNNRRVWKSSVFKESKGRTHLAKAFSSRADQNSFGVFDLAKINFPCLKRVKITSHLKRSLPCGKEVVYDHFNPLAEAPETESKDSRVRPFRRPFLISRMRNNLKRREMSEYGRNH